MTDRNRNRNRKHAGWHEDAFFGIHYDLHAEMQDTRLGEEATTAHLLERLQRVQPDWIQVDCKGHPGVTSWPTKVGTTSPGVVNDQLRMFRDATRELGIRLGMHYSGVWDTQAIVEHPEWARIDVEGVRDGPEHEGSDMTCRTSGYDAELMIPQMLELIDDYDVDGFWVDGEIWASKPCWCKRCTQKFREETGQDVPASPDDDSWEDWLSFHRNLFVEHVRGYAEAVHARNPGCLVVSNWMYTMRHPDPVEVPVDYLSGDFDWTWGADRAAVEGRLLDGRGMSWDLMAWGFTKTTPIPDPAPWALKSATQICQEAAEVVALGGAVMVYNTPQRTGWLTGWHQDTLAEVAQFCRARKETCFKSTSASEVAILHPRDHYYAANEGLFDQMDANHAIEGALHVLLESHYSVDILVDDVVLRDGLDRYKLVVIPERSALATPVRERVEQFVRDGGHLLVTGVEAAAGFAELAGVTADGEPVDETRYLRIGHRAVAIGGPWQPVTLSAGTEQVMPVLAQLEPDKDATSQAAVTCRSLGDGTVTAVHGPIFGRYYENHVPEARRVVDRLVRGLNVPWTIEVDGPPPLEVIIRKQGDATMVNLINRGAGETLSRRRVMFDHLEPLRQVTVRVRRESPPATVSLAPAMDPLPWQFDDGWLEIEVPVVRVHDIVVIRESRERGSA